MQNLYSKHASHSYLPLLIIYLDMEKNNLLRNFISYQIISYAYATFPIVNLTENRK